jgi:hypothetical protein
LSQYPREGWPVLTVETEVNGGSKSTNERGPFLVGSLVLSCRYKRFLFCLGCSSHPNTKYFFLTVHYFNAFLPIAQQAGQAAVLGRLSLCVSLDGLVFRCIRGEGGDSVFCGFLTCLILKRGWDD